jgi:acyl-CoA reductase-like NAD-dependent aldehyde dehydrogenase
MSAKYSSRLFIGGKWVATADTIPVVNPYTGEEIARAPQGGAGEIEDAIVAASRAFPEARSTSPHRRAELLLAVARGIEARKDEFTETMVAEAGKPVVFAEAETVRAVMTFTAAAEEARRQQGEVLDLDAFSSGESHFGMTRRFPLGVIAGITPFNFPLNLVAHKVAPCVATGNTMVVKLAPKTTLTGLLLARVIEEAGVPAGQVNFVTCRNEDVARLVTDDRVKMVSFTGSPSVGWKLKELSGRKRITLELGGNAGVILHEDADLDAAIPLVAGGGFAFAGQSCISVQRVFIHESRYEEAKTRLIAHIRDVIRTGDPHERSTVVGPMINAAALEQIRGRIDAAVASGAVIAHGGRTIGRCLEATVLENVGPELDLCAKEAFAPIVTLHRYREFEEALAMVNASEFGLQAGVFTRDLQLALRAFDALDTGGVLINQAPTFRVENMPYGGIKMSGFGREGVRYAMEEMTEIKSLIIRRS